MANLTKRSIDLRPNIKANASRSHFYKEGIGRALFLFACYVLRFIIANLIEYFLYKLLPPPKDTLEFSGQISINETSGID